MQKKLKTLKITSLSLNRGFKYRTYNNFQYLRLVKNVTHK